MYLDFRGHRHRHRHSYRDFKLFSGYCATLIFIEKGIPDGASPHSTDFKG